MIRADADQPAPGCRNHRSPPVRLPISHTPDRLPTRCRASQRPPIRRPPMRRPVRNDSDRTPAVPESRLLAGADGRAPQRAARRAAERARGSSPSGQPQPRGTAQPSAGMDRRWCRGRRRRPGRMPGPDRCSGEVRRRNLGAAAGRRATGAAAVLKSTRAAAASAWPRAGRPAAAAAGTGPDWPAGLPLRRGVALGAPPNLIFDCPRLAWRRRRVLPCCRAAALAGVRPEAAAGARQQRPDDGRG